MKPFKVLETYHWGKKGRYASKIGVDLCTFTESLGLVPFKNDEIQRNEKAAWSDYKLHAEVRMTAKPGSEGTSWHQDGDTSTNNMDCALVLWTNRDPTQFKFKGITIIGGKEIYTPEPFQIVIARNLAAYHRRPPNVSGRRWLFRQRVEVPDWL